MGTIILVICLIALVFLACDRAVPDKKPPGTKKSKGDKDVSDYLKSYDDGHLEEIKKQMEERDG